MIRYCRLFSVFNIGLRYLCVQSLWYKSGRFFHNKEPCNYYTYNDIFFSSESLNQKSVLSLHLDLKITFSLQYSKSLSVVRLSLALKSSESLPNYGKVKVNSLLGTMKLRSSLMNDLFENKFKRVNIEERSALNHLICMEEQVIHLLKNFPTSSHCL